ncbi:hypothetical protein GCM10023084_64740 [Streptomyces lacrimifluminis]|uniref:Uncharacterized protein n=1 Tax=Streptomyces lacrimifluminis TaxID=1500077 RepID=A0A917LDJ0_9ACTN|nr:hypothetical protein GCM10012282_64610 [Streptomyces lacrimifluminis]
MLLLGSGTDGDRFGGGVRGPGGTGPRGCSALPTANSPVGSTGVTRMGLLWGLRENAGTHRGTVRMVQTTILKFPWWFIHAKAAPGARGPEAAFVTFCEFL